MKRIKHLWNSFLEWLKITVQFIPTIAVTAIISYFVLAIFANKLCDDKSLCYTIVIFLTGIIVTLKIKLLDTQTDYYPLHKKEVIENNLFRHKERLGFKLGTALNVFFLFTAFWLDCLNKIDEVIVFLNVLIFFDFVVLMRNIIITVRTYKNQINIKPTIYERNDVKEEAISLSDENKDLFEEWLDKKSRWVQVALTDSSYKNKHLRENKVKYDGETNKDLATYGDSIIKVCFIEILYGNTDKLSVKKSNYESDKYLVEKVAKHYNLLDYMRYDSEDDKIVKDYDFNEPSKTKGGNRKDSPHKYIATAVEAMVGAIYKETKDMNSIIELLKSWMNFNDNV